MKLKLTEEMRKSIAETKRDMDIAMSDEALRGEVDGIKAEYAAQDLAKSIISSPAYANAKKAFRRCCKGDLRLVFTPGGGACASRREFAFA